MLSLDSQEFIAQAFLLVAMVSVAAAAATVGVLVLLSIAISPFINRR
jgi:hypothetical protein